jgi:hypothetical protein
MAILAAAALAFVAALSESRRRYGTDKFSRNTEKVWCVGGVALFYDS